MNDVVNRPIARMKIDKLEIRDFNLQRIITDALIDKGYDIDITLIESFPERPYQEFSIYEVRR